MDTYHRWMEVVMYGSLGGLPIVNVPVGFDAQGAYGHAGDGSLRCR